MTKNYAFRIELSSHAELSASAAERWLTCPGSVALSRGVPNRASEFSAGGTAAHYISAECERDGGSPKRWLGKVALVEGYEINIDEEMVEAIQDFLDDIAAREKPGDVVLIEQSFTAALKTLHPKFGGSGDRVTWTPSERLLRVTDLKFGAGIAVEADENKQLKMYALGALLSNPQWNAEDVELVVAQSRCEHERGRFRPYRFPAFDLLEFAADLIEGAKRTEEFGADLVPSKKACRFCLAAAANKCPAIDKHTQALVAADFTEVGLERYSREQIAEFLTMAPLVEQRISAVREFAYQQALHQGVDFPGWKIVDKRPRRKWIDEQEAFDLLRADPRLVTDPELRSPAQVEKIVGKKKFKAMCADMVEKKSSGHTLAAVDDNRPAVTPLLKVLELFEPEAPEQS